MNYSYLMISFIFTHTTMANAKHTLNQVTDKLHKLTVSLSSGTFNITTRPSKMPPQWSYNLGTEIKILSLLAGTFLVLTLGNYIYKSELQLSVVSSAARSAEESSLEVDLGSHERSSSDDDDDDEEDLSYRLPKNLVPLKYILKLQPVIPVIPEAWTDEPLARPLDGLVLYTIPGQVTITFTCAKRTNKIVLHQSNISINEDGVKVTKVDDNTPLPDDHSLWTVPVTGHQYDILQEFYTIQLGQVLEEGQVYAVHIPFTSYLSRGNTVGIFDVEYSDPLVNRTKHMVTTKFQATHARQGFPCLDEPEFKAKIQTIVGRTKGYHSLSNWPLSHTIEDQSATGWYWDHFQETAPMAVYLVCIAVSDFASQDATVASRSNRPVKVWAPKHIIDKGGAAYSANLTSKIITLLEDYFNMTDILPKIDSIMVPTFMTPAMENWGLITYKEDMIIYGENDSVDRQVVVTTVVAHELSHHWFGNLVTCNWWSDIWLNEGFATFLSYMIMEGLELNHSPEDMFIENVLQFTMTSDAQPSVRPLRSDAKTSVEIYDMFGTTSYRKGASLIRMIRNILGPENFRAALQSFMRKFSFSTATQEDLFHELNQMCFNCLPPGLTIQDVMEPWTVQAGYPTVHVDHIGDNKIRLTQEPFSLGLGEQETTEGHRWWIPVRITSASNPTNANFVWMPPNGTSITVDVASAEDWIHVNTHYAAYFLVTYDLHTSVMLQRQLEANHSVFSYITRSQILFDHIGAAKANYIPGEAVLNVTRYLGKEVHPLPWTSVYYYFHDLQRYLRMSREHIDAFSHYMVPKVEAVLQSPEVGLQVKEHEDYAMDHFRFSLLRIACRLGSDLCFSEARRIFQNLASDKEKPFETYDNGAEDILRCAMVRAVGTEAWEFMLSKFLNSSDRSVHWLTLRAMTCVETEELIQRTLHLCSNTTVLTDGVLRLGMLSNLLRNRYAAITALDFIIENVQLGPNETKLLDLENFGRLITALSEYPCGLDIIEKLKEFAGERKDQLLAAPAIRDGIHMMEEFGGWMEHYGDLYLEWLHKNTPKSS